MADLPKKAAKYKCSNNHSNASFLYLNMRSSRPRSNETDKEKFTSLLLFVRQTYSKKQWLESLKCVSLLMDHINGTGTETASLLTSTSSSDMDSNTKGRNRKTNNERTKQSHHLDNHIVHNIINVTGSSMNPVELSSRSTQQELGPPGLGLINYVQFKVQFLSIISEILAQVLTSGCLKQYSLKIVQGILNPIRKAYNLFIDVVTSIIQLFFSLDFKDAALQLALEIKQSNPESFVAEETFENMCCHVVDRWHFKMLNDVARNKAFESAIKSTFLQERRKTVCDIGSGTGLLSLISAGHADHIYAIEKSSLMCDIAQKVKRAGCIDPELVDKIEIINEMSTCLKIPENFPVRVDLLVTETFDAGLFGEGIISTLSHAWKELLAGSPLNHQDILKKASLVIPHRAKLYVEAISSADIRQDHSFHHNGTWHDINLANTSIVSVVAMVQSEPYSSYHLRDLPNGYKSLSEACLIMEVNFNDPNQIFNLEKGVSGTLNLNMKEKGHLDALAVWFELILTDDIHLSTHPGSEGCWEQAVFPVRNLDSKNSSMSKGMRRDPSLLVQKGDKVDLKYCLEEDRFSLHDVIVISEDDYCVTKDDTRVSNSNTLLTDTAEWWPYGIFCLRDWEISSLNNGTYYEKIHHQLKKWIDLHKETQTTMIDLHPGFSPMMLQALSDGCKEVYSVSQEDTQKACACNLAHINNMDMRRINFLSDASELTELEFHESKNKIQECSPLSSASFALCEVVDYQGRLPENLESNFECLRHALSGFSSKQILPQKVDVYGVFIESEKLQTESCIVSDENTLGFPIGQFLNEYSVTNHPGLTFCTLPHEKLTASFKMFSLDLMSVIDNQKPKMSSTSCKQETQIDDFTAERTDEDQRRCENNLVSSLSTGDTDLAESFAQDDSLPSDNKTNDDNKQLTSNSCFNQTVDLKIPIIKDGRLSALVYWFDIQLSPSEHILTNDPSFHWKQAAIMLENDEVSNGQEILVNVKLKNSNLRVSFKNHL